MKFIYGTGAGYCAKVLREVKTYNISQLQEGLLRMNTLILLMKTRLLTDITQYANFESITEC